MGLAEKQAYRFGFLKSEAWKDLRAEVMAKHDAKCRMCGVRNLSNDVHHLIYPKSFKRPKDCRFAVLCRGCHEEIHAQAWPEDKYKKLNAQLKYIGLKRKALKQKDWLEDHWMKEASKQLCRVFQALRKEGAVSFTVIVKYDKYGTQEASKETSGSPTG
jgi:hypothetical protein